MTNSSLSFPIESSVALVTGTNKSNGIGSHIVRALLEHGAAKVYATARDASQLAYLVEESDGKVVPVSLDVTDIDAIKALPAKYPDVTLLVNNAGIVGSTSESEFAIDGAKIEIDVNYVAPMVLVQSFAPVFQKASENGKVTSVVNINSIASLVSFPGVSTYSASKAAAHSLTQAQRRALPETLVVGVYPGPIDTEMAKDFTVPKTSPRDVALRVVEALEEGVEDVFPDPMAIQLYEGWKADAKAMEEQMAQSAASSA